MGIISSFAENNIPEKGYNRFVFLIFATNKVYNDFGGVSLHSEVICLEYVPKMPFSGTRPKDMYPKMAFWVHIQSVVLQIIDERW